jgi:hypothetical protein
MGLQGGFNTTGTKLLEMLSNPEAEIPLAPLHALLDVWAEDFDRGEKQDPADSCNKMHLVGASLCVLLHRSQKLDTPGYNLRRALGRTAGRVLLCDKELMDYDIEELQHLVTALQIEFASLYSLENAGGEGQAEGEESSAGYWALVDIEEICIHIMTRLGALLAVKQKMDMATDGADPSVDPSAALPPAALRGLLDVDSTGFCSVRTETFVFLLDALHSIYSLHSLLTRATLLSPVGELVELHSHHREASNETFFTHSMTSDCVVGTIAQYAHRFAHLFHSVSQTIYYNQPTYARQTQLPLATLQLENTSAVNVLPLLTELYPTIPVLFEHTGAGCRSQHAKHQWSWVLWSRFVLLVNADMQTFVARDLRTLATHATQNE